ncbi:DUF3341 domain-containing protein [Ichthyobacterium seriolicida]|uniref:ABC-type Fe3+ transport system protein n=1 Tax=Ichthyobacterium seriolicida TaxID=242600 RepID=A0A1J1E003_9FLAO|nr:DUF3341 domain-containing protein [Ichthyobacterium seriolicida]BAV94261.1 ABC-type Fe3+ transport system protein [Ichthyobacterium seriolicida]
MGSNYKTILAVFDDDDIVLGSVKRLREEGYYVEEVFSPFPIHGLDKAMGLAPTRMGITSFIYGCCGLTFAILLTSYMMNYDWIQDIGGKPANSWFYNMPSFVPIMFELTVFCAAHLMVFTFFFRCDLYPGKMEDSPDIRITDDKFVMEVVLEGDEDKLKDLLRETGAIEIKNKP